MSNKSSALKRRLTLGRCQYCGRNFFSDKRTGRPRLFCDKKCRDGDFRRLRYLTLKNVETPQKTEVKSKTSRPDFDDRPPLNLLGGHRWHGRSIDREVLVQIIETEIGERRRDCNPAAPNKYIAQIPADLSIPPFLRRGSA